tara:strand:- start:53 stop:331 length:279 start_codon:yes stop_codon:yes gene_type:complete
LIIGFFLLSCSPIVVTLKLWNNKSRFYKKLLIRLAAFWLIGFILIALPENTILEFTYRNFPEYLEAQKKANANPQDSILSQKAREEYEKIVN